MHLVRLVLALWILLLLSPAQAQTQHRPPIDNLAQRLAACTFCHGEQGRAGPDGYYPRLAGKPAGYLYHQLLNFQQGRRPYRPMAALLQHQDDAYLRDMAEHFATQKEPYPAPVPVQLNAAQSERAQQLVLRGDAALQIPACAGCHGQALMGTLPAVPGLLGLPRDYLSTQLGAWRTGQRRAHAPDCMGEIARRLAPDDVATLSAWLSSQTAPTLTTLPPTPAPAPMKCGSALAAQAESQ